jgi:PAS domain S-box-containing protein
LEIVQKKCPDLPFIFVSGAIGEESALETLKKGATDYVLKDRLFRLVPAVDRALREVGQRAEREQAEEALRESEGRFRTLFEAIPDNVLVHDNEGVILHINEIGAQQLEWSAKDLIGKNLHEILAPEQKPLIADHIRETHKIGWSRFETTYVSRSNWKIEVEVNDRLIKFGEKKAILCVSRDITERKEAEKALLRERNFSNSVINSSPDLLFVFGGKGNIIRWNSNAENITGYSAKEIAKMNIMDFVAEEDSKAAAEAAQEAFATGQASVEINLRSKSGKLIPFYIIGRRTKIENTDCIVCTGIDITERRRAEEEVKRSYEQLHETLISTVNALAATVEMKDQYTAGHQSRVAQLTCAIAQAMGLSEERIEGIRMAASIHDIGKLIVPTEILNKPGTLTEIQFNMIKMHPQTGYDILKGIEFPWPVAQIILQHHELMDGSGYPQGLSGENIMLEARILTVADVVEAMTSHRPYRPAYHIRKAIAEISKNGGALYDPEVVDACIKLFTEKAFMFREEAETALSSQAGLAMESVEE